MNSIRVIMQARGKSALTLRAVQALVDDGASEIKELVLLDQALEAETESMVRAIVEERFTVEVLPGVPGATFAQTANLYGTGSTPDFLLFLDNDTEIVPGAIDAMIAALAGDVRAAAIGPKLVYASGQIEQAGLALPLWLVPFPVGQNARRDDHRFNFPRAAFAVSTSCLLVRRVAFDLVGGFDEVYEWGFEAADLAIKLRKRNFRVLYEPRAECLHAGGATLNDFPELSRIDENRRAFLERWGVELFGKVGSYLERLIEDGGTRRFLIFGTGEAGRHLANTLEVGGYEVTGFLSANGVQSVDQYPAWNVNEEGLDKASRVLIGTPYVREAEDSLAEAGLLAGAAMPVLVE